MTKDVKTIRETEVQAGGRTDRYAEVNDPAQQENYERNVVQRVVWYITGVIIALLLLRFVFALLGANQTNGLAEFVYTVTAPLVSPFTNLFSFDGIQYGISSLEVFTLVAVAFYALVGYGVAKIFDISRR